MQVFRALQSVTEASNVFRELALARGLPAWRSTRRPSRETSHSYHAARTGEQRRKDQRGRGKLRWGLDTHNAGPARPRGHARQFPQHQSGWPLFFALMSSFSRETEFTKFVSREIATARSGHKSWRRWIPMPASPRHRARCNRHEARAGFVALISCCRQAQHRRFGFAMVPLQRAAWTRYLSVVMSETAAKQFFFRCAQRNSYLRSRTCQLFMRPREAGLTDKPPPSRPQRISSPLASVSLLVPQLCRCSIGSPHACSSFFALHSQNVTLQICLHIATLLSGAQICFRSVRRCEGRA